MPELPDVELYLHALGPRILGQVLERVRLTSPFLLRSVEPPLSAVEGRRVVALRRLGKRIVWQLEDDFFVVIHLMIAGRFRWLPGSPKAEARRRTAEGRAPKAPLASFSFGTGTLILTEAGAKKRASLHVEKGIGALGEHDRGGLEVLQASASQFADRLRLENRTLKRALTDPGLFSGIGNAYSDEILHAARLSPMQLTSNLEDGDVRRLFESAQSVLTIWTGASDRRDGGTVPGERHGLS